MEANPLDYKISDINSLNIEKGRILISEPFMHDPYFRRSVVLMVEHSEKGSFGFILNKSLEFQVGETLKDFPSFDSSVFMGGPVQPDHLFFIHNRGTEIEGSVQIGDNLFWAGDFEQVKESIKLGKIHEEEIRFFLGYSGWDADQLNREIEEESWIISDIQGEDLFNITPEELWRTALINMGNDCVAMANFPEDPKFN